MLAPLLDERQLLRSLLDYIFTAFAKEKIKLVGFFELQEVFEQDRRDFVQTTDKAGVHMFLEDVACYDQEEDVEIVRLVVSELNEAVVGQQRVVLLESEVLVSIA